ncbi:MAG: universal stress protein, partial [Bacteroidales bacterium]
MIASERLVTLAIHTYDRGVKLKQILEHYGIEAVINNVNLIRQSFSSAVRVRICEKDLSRALQITEGKSLDDLYLSISEMECEEKMKILIPVDFSESSIKECQIGFDLAERFNAEVVLLHSFLGSNQGGGLLFRGNSYKMLDIITAKEDVDTKFEAVDKMEELIDKLNILVANGNLPNINFIFEI